MNKDAEEEETRETRECGDKTMFQELFQELPQ